jgi:hypothetical protein
VQPDNAHYFSGWAIEQNAIMNIGKFHNAGNGIAERTAMPATQGRSRTA